MRKKVCRSKYGHAWCGLLILWAVWLGLPAPVQAGDIRVFASVDNPEITLEDVLNLEVTVEGVENAPPPALPALQNFKIRSQGQSSSLKIINGQRSAAITFNYQLIPEKTGAFTIGAFQFDIDGKPYRTEPIEVTVRRQAQKPGVDRTVFAEVSVPTHQPYVSELLPLTLKIYRKTEVRNLNIELDLDAFRKENLGPPRQYTRVLGGVRYNVYEWNTALYPLRPGKTTIPSALVELDIVEKKQGKRPLPLDPFFDDPFFKNPFFHDQYQLKHKILRTDPIELEVLPLPDAGRPDPFSNLVGQFTLTAKLSRQKLARGDTVTLTVTVSGEGNPMDAVLHLPDLEDTFKVYADQPEYEQTVKYKTLSGKKVFKYALVPLKAGALTFPPVRLSYFDPKAHRYKTVETEPMTLEVEASPLNETLQAVEPEPSRPEIRQSMKDRVEDIHPIHTNLEDFTNQRLGAGFWAAAGLGLLAPALAYLIFVRVYRHRQRLQFDTAYERRLSAYRRAEERLNRLAAERNGNDKEYVRELSQIVRSYIGDKLNMKGTAFTSREVEDQLRQWNFREDQIASTRKLLEKYEALQYSAEHPADPDTLLEESRNLIKKLEAV